MQKDRREKVKKTSPTSWQKVGKWYNEAVGEEGHYYHQAIILPNTMKLLDFKEKEPASLLDLACGQGVLSRQLPPQVDYLGIDAASSLIAAAKKYPHPANHRFLQADLTQKLVIQHPLFSHGSILLALQNIEKPEAVFQNAARYLTPGAPFVMVINHPCFRIPRQSSWKVDEEQKIQYRRIDRYMSSMQIPIQTHPGKGKDSPQTFSFHYPLSDFSRWLHSSGFVIELIEEWCSNKVSEGKAAKMENRSREEIPLFMAIKARKHM